MKTIILILILVSLAAARSPAVYPRPKPLECPKVRACKGYVQKDPYCCCAGVMPGSAKECSLVVKKKGKKAKLVCKPKKYLVMCAGRK